MKITESILTRINAMLAMGNLNDARPDLQQLADDLADKVRAEYAAERGEANAARTINALLKSVKKINPYRQALHYAWLDEKGRQCVLDGFRAFRLNDPLPLEERPADAGDPVDMNKIIPDVRKCKTVALPDVKEVKAHIALERSKRSKAERKEAVLWDFGEGLPCVNAAYLVDLMNVLPDATELYYRDLFDPIYAKSERGDALICPVATEAKKAEAAKLLAAQKAQNDAANRSERISADDRAMRNNPYLQDALELYKRHIAADPKYSLTPDAFAELVECASRSDAA